MQVTIDTKDASSLELLEAAQFIGKLAALREAVPKPSPRIAHVDRPDVGAPEVPVPPTVAAALAAAPVPNLTPNPSEVFGNVQAYQGIGAAFPPAAAAPVAPPLPPNAPSTAAVAALPTAPVVPLAPLVATIPAATLPAPPTAPAAAAPSAAPTTPAGVELDASGLPWDVRIHSGSRTRTADGKWRMKKGINDAALVRRVEEELRALMALPAGGVPPLDFAALVPPQVPQPPVPPQDPFLQGIMQGVPQPPTAAAPVPVPLPPGIPVPSIAPPAASPATSGPASSGAPASFIEFMTKLGPHMAPGGKLPIDNVQAIARSHGLPDITGLASRPDMLPNLWASVCAALAQP